ncbi:MAG: hypothetical protein ACREAM_17185, partial [Blastocatellia bacterium]
MRIVPVIRLGPALAGQLVEMNDGEKKAEMQAVEIKKRLDPNGNLNLDGLRILVVDDEADARDLLAIRLQQYGAEVITGASVEAAMEVLAQEGPRPD